MPAQTTALLLPSISLLSVCLLVWIVALRNKVQVRDRFIKAHHGDVDPDEEEELREEFDAPENDE